MSRLVYGGVPVPYTVSWTGEAGFRVVGHAKAELLAWTDRNAAWPRRGGDQ